MSARDEILSNIRHSLGVTGREASRRANVRHRLETRPTGVIPARGQGDAGGRLARFMEEARRVSATVLVLENATDVAAEIARYLTEAGLPLTIRTGEDARLAALEWGKAGLTVTRGASRGDDLTAVSHAFAGVAETGSVVVLSGPDNPATLNYLPDNHIVILSRADLQGDLEAVWALLRTAVGGEPPPRTVNIITGPSRSADIEQTLLLGAHGPRSLAVLVTP
ncbi:MAG: lactate utilization protein [Beijerinckiaceae bacterium]|jgi:L-lactate dehydrogenase complex protein LldG|nr:lactate utilization protein [Beijerinckiaceae bacterium]